MFDYTKAALKKVVDDFKKILLCINVGTQLLTISYLILALCMGMGVLIANAILLTLAASYFVFFLYMEISKKKEKELKRRVKEIYAWCKRFIKLLSII